MSVMVSAVWKFLCNHQCVRVWKFSKKCFIAGTEISKCGNLLLRYVDLVYYFILSGSCEAARNSVRSMPAYHVRSQ